MIGQTVTHYRITARLGEGGMGIVYEAEDLRLPRHVALEFLPAGHVQDHAARERGRPADARSDLFSLGVVLYEMATGARPFPGDSMGVVFDAILHKAPTSPVRLNPRMPVELERIVNRCLEKDAAKRWASAADLRGALRRCLDDLQHSGSATALARRWARDRRVWAAGLSLLAALAVGGFAYARHRAHVRWAREEALPEIRRLASSGLDSSRPAFLLAERALRYLPRDPELHQLRDSVSADCEVLTDPPGASVWIKPYEKPGSAWEHIVTVENLWKLAPGRVDDAASGERAPRRRS